MLTPGKADKIILSTNVAETSLTVPGVTSVVDSGLTRQSRVSSWSGIKMLITIPASQASANQRTGRAGRLREGFCTRLYSKYDFEHRAPFDIPEILRSDLSNSLLKLASLGVEDIDQFPWLLKPTSDSINSARNLLIRIGALSSSGHLTPLGQQMARFPFPHVYPNSF